MGDKVSPNQSSLANFVMFICSPLYAEPHVTLAESVVWLDVAMITSTGTQSRGYNNTRNFIKLYSQRGVFLAADGNGPEALRCSKKQMQLIILYSIY